MTQRKAGPGTSKPTAAQKSAGSANLAKGRAAKAAKAAQAKAEGRMSGTERWARLLDGSLTVHDLDDEEVARMKVKGRDGSFGGSRRAIPSHLAQQFHQEIIRRAEADMRGSLSKAVALLGKVIDDPEARHSDQIKAAQLLMDRVMGKTPETVVLKAEDRFADLLGDAIVEDRDLGDMSPVDE